jgi:CMP-N-acetylneuraminic acid synthetase/RimJ/RimL family protein N-acetyltransferase
VSPSAEVTLRPACREDAVALWRWRNDPGTRRASFEQDKIPLARHRRWFAEALGRSDRRIYVVRADGVDAGMVRIDVRGREGTVSVNLATDRRGQGLGSAALRAMAAEAFGRLGLRRLLARVKTDNPASRRAFERAGFAPVGRARGVLTLTCSAPSRRDPPRPLCIIPARGGSKRFPRKNVASFEGTPLVVRAVQVAAEANVFGRIVVSTEDPEIALLAKRAGAEVHDRPPTLATDSARVVDVCEAVLDQLEREGERVATFCVLVPTSPLRTARHVRESLALLRRGRINGVMSVSVFPHAPLWAVREVGGFLRLQWGRGMLKARQRLPALYRHNGVALWMQTAAFRRYRDFYCPRLVPYVMTLEESVDVDDPIDLAFAEFLGERQAR